MHTRTIELSDGRKVSTRRLAFSYALEYLIEQTGGRRRGVPRYGERGATIKRVWRDGVKLMG